MQTAFLFRTGKLLEKSVFSRLYFPEIFDKSFQKGKAPIGQVHQGGPAGFDRRSNLNFGSGSSQVQFRSPKILQNFSYSPSHRIFGHMHEALNINKKIKLITQLRRNPRDESFTPN